MKMIRCFDAMLFLAGQAELAAPADARGEADADQHAHIDIGRLVVNTWTERDDTSNSFVAADVWEFDVYNGSAGGGCCGSAGGVEVWEWLLSGREEIRTKGSTYHFGTLLCIAPSPGLHYVRVLGPDNHL